MLDAEINGVNAGDLPSKQVGNTTLYGNMISDYRFEETPYPGGKTVRFIVEHCNTANINQGPRVSDLHFKYNGEEFYTKLGATQYIGSRSTRHLRDGAPYNPDFNLSELIAQRICANYDLSLKIPETTIASNYLAWLNSVRDINGKGTMHENIADPASRPDIGPLPTWVMRWLYTKDPRCFEEVEGNAELAGRWAIHYRESRTANQFYGRPIQISDRPDLFFNQASPPWTRKSGGDWQWDIAHQPDLFSMLAAITQDHYWYEQMCFWVGASAGYNNGPAINNGTGRGPTGREGGITGMGPGQLRSQAWTLLRRALAAFILPVSFPEKALFAKLTDDFLAEMEGQRDIKNGAFFGHVMWDWSKKYLYPNYGGKLPPNHHWERGLPGFVQGFITNTVATALSAWESNFMIFALGRCCEMGFKARALLDWFSDWLLGQLRTTKWTVGVNRSAVTDYVTRDYFPDFASTVPLHTVVPESEFKSRIVNLDHGYPWTALAASSMVCSANSSEWKWIKSQTLDANRPNSNPKWAILPRSDMAAPLPTKPTGLRRVYGSNSDLRV